MSKGTDYMTVVFRMPNDVAQRKAFSAALQFGEEFHLNPREAPLGYKT